MGVFLGQKELNNKDLCHELKTKYAFALTVTCLIINLSLVYWLISFISYMREFVLHAIRNQALSQFLS